MSFGLLLYLIVGMVWVHLENRMFNISFESKSKSDTVLIVLQQIIHCIRVLLVWPLYWAEDFVLYCQSKLGGTEDEVD